MKIAFGTKLVKARSNRETRSSFSKAVFGRPMLPHERESPFLTADNTWPAREREREGEGEKVGEKITVKDTESRALCCLERILKFS